jgi:hypothetical protein
MPSKVRPAAAAQLCPACGKPMRLFGIEPHDTLPHAIVHTYDCACGEIVAVSVTGKQE